MKLPPTVRSIYEFPFTTRFQKGLYNSIVPLGVNNTNSSEKAGTSSEKAGPSSEKGGPSSENSVTEGGDIDMSGTPEILPYAFYPDRPPTTRQIIYQFCDIRCAEAQKLISANDGRVREGTVLFCISFLTCRDNKICMKHALYMQFARSYELLF
jgi:hypothetical protein